MAKEIKTIPAERLKPGMILAEGREIDEIRKLAESYIIIFWKKKEGRELTTGRFVLPSRGGGINILIFN